MEAPAIVPNPVGAQTVTEDAWVGGSPIEFRVPNASAMDVKSSVSEDPAPIRSAPVMSE